jgi:hypothetical protein
LDWVSFLAYPSLFGIKGFVVVVVLVCSLLLFSFIVFVHANLLSLTIYFFVCARVLLYACMSLQLVMLKSFHVRLMSIVLDVDVDPSSTPWDPAKAYLFIPVISNNSPDPIKDIDWDLVEAIVKTDAWNNPLHRARPDVYLGTNERTLGGDKREYGFGKLRHGIGTVNQ